MTTFQLTDVMVKVGYFSELFFAECINREMDRTDHAVHGNHMHVPCVVVSLMVSVSCKYISFFPLPM